MNSFVKYTVILIAGLCSTQVFAQEQAPDLGVIFSTYNPSKTTVEFRKHYKDNRKLRLGIGYGAESTPFLGNSRAISSTDTSVIFETYSSQSHFVDFRIGLERQFRTSYFSIGADLNIGYQNLTESYIHRAYIDDNKFEYYNGGPENFQLFEPLTGSRANRHYLMPGVRVSLNLNVPLGNAFIFNVSLIAETNVPVYLGQEIDADNYNKFIGSPPFTINSNVMAAAGIRYVIQKKKKQ